MVRKGATKGDFFVVGEAEATGEPIRVYKTFADKFVDTVQEHLERRKTMQRNYNERLLKGTTCCPGLNAVSNVVVLHECKGFKARMKAYELCTQLLNGEVLPQDISDEPFKQHILNAYETMRGILDDLKRLMGEYTTYEGEIAEVESRGPGYGIWVRMRNGRNGTIPMRKFVKFEANKVAWEAYHIREEQGANTVIDPKTGRECHVAFRPHLYIEGDYCPHIWESRIEFQRGWAMMMEQALAPTVEKYGKGSPQEKEKLAKLVEQYWEAVGGFGEDMGTSLYGQSRYFANFQHPRADIPEWSRDPIFYMSRYIEEFISKVELDSMVVECWKLRRKMEQAGERPEVIQTMDVFLNDALRRPKATNLKFIQSRLGRFLTDVLHIPISKGWPFGEFTWGEGRLLHILAFIALVGFLYCLPAALKGNYYRYSGHIWVFALSMAYLLCFVYWRFADFMRSRKEKESSED